MDLARWAIPAFGVIAGWEPLAGLAGTRRALGEGGVGLGTAALEPAAGSQSRSESY